MSSDLSNLEKTDDYTLYQKVMAGSIDYDRLSKDDQKRFLHEQERMEENAEKRASERRILKKAAEGDYGYNRSAWRRRAREKGY